MVNLKTLIDTRSAQPLLPLHNSQQKPPRQDFYYFILKLLGMFCVCSLLALFAFQMLTAVGQQISFTAVEKSNLQYTNPMVYAVISRFQQRKNDSSSLPPAHKVSASMSGCSGTISNSKFDLPMVDDSDVFLF
jgi:hypothetical protein